MSYKEDYNNLEYRYRRLSNNFDEVKKDRDELRNKLDSAEYKLETELKPRVDREKRSYDSWVINGGGDTCMQQGMDGNCGFNCPDFGDKEECTSELSDQELLEVYYEGYDCVEDDLIEKGYELDIRKKDLADYTDIVLKDKKKLKSSLKLKRQAFRTVVKLSLRRTR